MKNWFKVFYDLLNRLGEALLLAHAKVAHTSLKISYYEVGPYDGEVLVYIHGFGDSKHGPFSWG